MRLYNSPGSYKNKHLSSIKWNLQPVDLKPVFSTLFGLKNWSHEAKGAQMWLKLLDPVIDKQEIKN